MIIVTAIREKQEHFLQQIVHFVNLNYVKVNF